MMPERQFVERLGDPNEPEEVRHLTKKLMHARLAEDWYLPDKNCRGVTRQYLVGVFRGNIFRINFYEMQRFLADLHKDQLKRVPYMNSADIKAKVEVQLQEQNFPPLGYAANIIPEEEWLVNVARWLDQPNNCAIFLHPINNPQVLNTLTQQMKVAKTNCKNFLLGGLGHSRPTYEDVEHLWQAQKRYVNRQREVAALEAHLAQSNIKLTQLGNQVSSALSRAALTVYKEGTEDNDPASLYQEGQVGQNVRHQIGQIQRL